MPTTNQAIYSPSGSGQVHVDQVLTNISIEWPGNKNFIGSTLFPAVRVRKQTDKYYIYDREMWKVEAIDTRTPGGVAHEIPGRKLSTDQYYVQEHALSHAVPDEVRENADMPLTPDADATELVTSRILLGREKAMKDMITTAANYHASNQATLVGTAQWSDYSGTSDPIANMRTAIRRLHAILFEDGSLVAVIPWLVMSFLEDHPDIIERIKYSERAVLTPEIVASVLGVQRVIVPGVGYSTAGMGVDASSANITYLWGKDVILAYVPATAGLRKMSTAYEFVQPYGGTEQVVDRWREDPRKSDLVRCSRRYDLKLVGHEGDNLLITAYIIKNAIA
jgi:hypothetical protein